MKFSVKRLLFLTVGLLTVSLNVSPMKTDVGASEASKFFGGASSMAELKGRIDANFDSFGCVWGHCLPNASPGLADTKLREVGAVEKQTRVRLGDVDTLSHPNPTIAKADRVELERREAALSRVGECLTGFEKGLKSAKKRIMVEASTVDQVAKMHAKDVDAHGLSVAKFVNQQKVLPRTELELCLDRTEKDFTDEDGYEDPVVRATIRSVRTLTDDAKKYEKSIQAVDRADRALARTLAKQARDKELCAVNASPWGCRTKHALSDITDGWMAVSDMVVDKAAATKNAVKGFDWEGRCEAFGPCHSVRQTFTAQPDWAKGAEAAALAAVGLYAAYKLTKLGWRGACALKNLLWTNRSAKARAAIALIIGTAVTAGPTMALQYGYLQ